MQMYLIKKVIDRMVEIASCSLLLIMVVLTLWQVFSRYVLNSPSTSSTEFLQYALIWTSLLGASYLFGKKQHLSFVFFKEKFSGRSLLALNILIEVIILVFSILVLIYGGIKVVTDTMGQTSPSLGIPVGYTYLIMPISGILIFIYNLINFTELITKKQDAKN